MFDALEAATRRREDAHARDMALAWTVGYVLLTGWHKGKLPELRTLIGGDRRPAAAPGQTKAEQIEAARAIFGDRVRSKHDRAARTDPGAPRPARRPGAA